MQGLPNADEPHEVPSGYWKILAIEQSGSIKVQAFLFDQETEADADYCDHRTTVDAVEARSGLDFYHELRATKQAPLESGAGTLAAELGCGA